MGSVIRESFSEFWRGTVSKIGVVFLVFVIVVSLYTVISMPLDFGKRFWSNPVYWVNNPKTVPPTWVNIFSSEKLLEHSVLETDFRSSTDYVEGSIVSTYKVEYDLEIEQFPKFYNLNLYEITYHESPPTMVLQVDRPDGYSIQLLTYVVEKPQPDESPPYIRFSKDAKRFLVSGEAQVPRSLVNYLFTRYDVLIPPSQVSNIGFIPIIFGDMTDDGSFKPLKGKYTLSVIMTSKNPDDRIARSMFVLGGQVYGFMGTDSLGRDLAFGLLFGFPVALLIGFATSVITTILGASLGIISGYVGGITDEIIQRVSDIINNFPLLPLLIFLIFVFGGKLWLIVLVLVIFGWPGLTIIVRSMILSIKSASFIESAKSIGASRWRIMGRHIFPQVAPYILSQMIFYTPSAILSEAALSFLGLGDPTLPTWGQILEYAFRNSAVYLGYWWWVLPPGLLIVYSAITFVFIAIGLEPVVNPRLRRWR